MNTPGIGNNSEVQPLKVEQSLVHGFFSAVEKFPERIAIEQGDQSRSYLELYQKSAKIAQVILSNQVSSPYVGVLARRECFAFEGILASLFSAKAWVPFDYNLEPEKLLELVKALDCRIFLVDADYFQKFERIFSYLPAALIIAKSEVGKSISDSGAHQLVSVEDQLISEEVKVGFDKEKALASIYPSSLAYVLFTSGSTGRPKAVPISHENICHYLAAINHLYPMESEDRCTQAFDLSFDPSVHDMFSTWFSGACLCVMNEKERLGAHYFIQKHNISIWNSIPSLIKLCLSLRSFKEKYLTSLRRVYFNGEALQSSVADVLQGKVPQAELVNLYGLTETTVNLCHYLWEGEGSVSESQEGIVAIGKLFPGISMEKQTSASLQCAERDCFELLVSGKQVFSGYLELDPKAGLLNESLFEICDGKRFLKTGDIVFTDENDNLHILGRRDEQVKVRGRRVDLNLVRLALEEASGCLDALVLIYTGPDNQAEIAGFLQGEDFDLDRIQGALAEKLEMHMRPNRIVVLPSYPYLVSGKVDRKKLQAMLLDTKSD